MAERSPSTVAKEASALYDGITAEGEVGLFDERDFFLGETALLAGRSYRHLGQREEAETWLDRADAAFRHTINPGPSLSNVAYARLALKYEFRRYREVVDLIPSVVKSFQRFGMELEVVKCKFLLSAALKQIGRNEEAFAALVELHANPAAERDPAIKGQILIEIGEHLSSRSRFGEAIANFQTALRLLQAADRPIALANLKFVLGETFRKQGNLAAALAAFREALHDCTALGMTTYVAYLHVLVAETLLAMERPREAEWEILATLPTIETEKMVPEGFAAVALLQESVRRRSTDRKALRELRNYLEARS